MRPRYLIALLAACPLATAEHAYAHGFAGDHMFVSTLLIDDSNVADEASMGTFSFLPQPASSGPSPVLYQGGFEFDKRITENFGFAIGQGYNVLTQPGGGKNASGFSNLVVTLKYKAYVNDAHEFMMSVGLAREFATGVGGTVGSSLNGALGADNGGSTEPVVYVSKGFGDLPIGILRPFAVTGELGYNIADRALRLDPATGDPANNGNSNYWAGGLSLQYSMRYLSAQVKDYGLPEFVNKLTPLVELSYQSTATQPSQLATQYLWGIGVNYTATDYAVTAEMLVPGNRNTGSHLGAIAQFHLYFDDMFPNSLGKPIAEWF